MQLYPLVKFGSDFLLFLPRSGFVQQVVPVRSGPAGLHRTDKPLRALSAAEHGRYVLKLVILNFW